MIVFIIKKKKLQTFTKSQNYDSKLRKDSIM